MKMIIAVLLVLEMINAVFAQQGGRGNCNSQLNSLLPCLSYVQGQASDPPQACCGGLKSVAAASPACLCTLISSNSASIPGINSTLALQLPAKCKLQGLNPSLCNANLQVPSASPSQSPSQALQAPAPAPARRRGGHKHKRRPAAAPVISANSPISNTPSESPNDDITPAQVSQSQAPVASANATTSNSPRELSCSFAFAIPFALAML